MKLRVVRFGKPAFAEYGSLAETYQKRLKSSFKIDPVELKLRPQFQHDADILFEACAGDEKNTKIIVFDETGAKCSSIQFATQLSEWVDDSRIGTLIFVIGPPFGFPSGFLEKAHKVYSLSHCTFTSDLAWLTLWEQLYRATSIIKGSSYHHV